MGRGEADSGITGGGIMVITDITLLEFGEARETKLVGITSNDC
ncbi:MAG: hypothetical protein QW290_07075 [Sulfolobales archaeon]